MSPVNAEKCGNILQSGNRINKKSVDLYYCFYMYG